MKLSRVLFAMFFLLAGCKTHTGNVPSIIGVWELKEVRISKMSLFPLGAFGNRKEIYTGDGLYYETAAESTQVKDRNPKRYTYGDGIVTFFSTDGENRTLQSVDSGLFPGRSRPPTDPGTSRPPSTPISF